MNVVRSPRCGLKTFKIGGKVNRLTLNSQTSAKMGFKLVAILLSQLPKCWDYKMSATMASLGQFF